MATHTRKEALARNQNSDIATNEQQLWFVPSIILVSGHGHIDIELRDPSTFIIR